jgi:hypothetical protein
MTSKRRFPRLLYLLTALFCLILAGVSLFSSAVQPPTDSLPAPDELSVTPVSYAENLVIPYNIAPLNFRIQNEAYDYLTSFVSTKGKPVVIKGNDVRINKQKWKNLLEANKGEALLVTVYVKRDGIWFHFPTIRYQIAMEPIDSWVLYRTTQPSVSYRGEMVLIQRNLESFKEKTIFSCTVADESNKAELSNALFPSYHPTLPVYANTVDKNGKLVAFMNQELSTTFNESASILLTSTTVNEANSSKDSSQNKLEAFPSWSKDGKYLFSSIAVTGSNPTKASAGKTVHFNLVRRSFLSSSVSTGQADTLVNAALLGKSAVSPCLSPDGRYLLFCMTDDGNKPLWHKSSDLFVLDLSNGAWRQLDIVNSSEVDNQPVWSSNGRWMMFGSNRTDGTYTRLYLAYFDNEGMVHKPFIVPQKYPSRDEETFFSCNTPTFLSKPNTTSQLRLLGYLLDIFEN